MSEIDPKYKITSDYRLNEGIVAGIMIGSIALVFMNSLTKLHHQLITILILAAIFLWLVKYIRKKTIVVYFFEDRIAIDWRFENRKLTIDYADIYEYQYLNPYRGPTWNKLKCKSGQFSFSTIPADEYINFVKWIKSKNEKINFTVVPSDDYMNHKLQEEFGFKYRKILKKTL